MLNQGLIILFLLLAHAISESGYIWLEEVQGVQEAKANKLSTTSYTKFNFHPQTGCDWKNLSNLLAA